MKNRTSIDPTTPTAPVCWQRESATACLRIELESSEIHLLPYNHLISARLTLGTGGTESLQITFSAREVQIEGHNLRDLLLGIQDFAIKWLRAVPERYHAVAPIRDGVITSLQIASVD